MIIDPERDHGRVVWAKISPRQPAWAALIISTKKLNLHFEESEGKVWVWWLSANNMSNIKYSFIFDFASEYANYSKNLKGKRNQGLLDAIEILSSQLNIAIPEYLLSSTELILWAQKNLLNESNSQSGEFFSEDILSVPTKILDRIQAINLQQIANAKSVRENLTQFKLPKLDTQETEHLCNLGISNCVSCHEVLTDKTFAHPFLIGNICEVCFTKLKNNLLGIRNCKVCSMCFNKKEKDNYVSCNTCVRVYCVYCLLANCKETELNKIKSNRDDWLCLACDITNFSISRVWISRSLENQKSYVTIFELFSQPEVPSGLQMLNIPLMQVLALGDYQKLAKTILTELGHPFKVIDDQPYINYFEDHSVDNPILNDCSELDLLLQCYPSSSSTFIAKKCGTMEAYFQFWLLKNQINDLKLRNGKKLFWCFECSAAITSIERQKISSFCKKEPILIGMNVKDVLKRGRFIWTNVVLSNKSVSTYRKTDLFLKNLKYASDEGNWCYPTVYLILSNMIQNHIA